MRSKLKEFLADIFFYGLGVGMLALLGFVLYLAYQGEHPQPKHHWSQGPQDPEGTD